MRVSTPMISGSSPKPYRGIHCRCRAVGRFNLASRYVMNAAHDHAAASDWRSRARTLGGRIEAANVNVSLRLI
jgi:hypothetical protein